MNRPTIFAAGSCGAVLALLAACGTDTTTTVIACPDSGVLDGGVQNEASTTPPDAGHEAGPAEAGTDYAPATTTLRKLGGADSYWLVGVTSGATPHAVYYAQTSTGYALKALPVAGGDEVVLATDIDPFTITDLKAIVTGGAVTWADTATSSEIAPAIHVWTHASGVKTITTTSLLTQFWATEDGATIAFSANAVAGKTSDIVITSAANPVLTNPVLSGANAENIAVNTDTCPTKLGFAGTRFVASYCTGSDISSKQEQLVTVDTIGASPLTAVVRIGNANASDAYDGAWLSDATGTNLFVKDSAGNGRVLATSGASTTVGTVGVVQADVTVAPDGSVVLYRDTNKVLSKATFAASPVVTSLGTGVGQILAVTKDSKLALLTNTTTAQHTGNLTAVDITSATANPAPITLVPTDTALLAGITGDAKRAVYYEGNANGTLILSTVALSGGPAVVLNPAAYSAVLSQTGTGVISLFEETPVLHSGTATHISLSYSDAAKGGLLEQPYAGILDGQDVFSVTGKTFVYRDVGTNVGIYAIDMP